MTFCFSRDGLAGVLGFEGVVAGVLGFPEQSNRKNIARKEIGIPGVEGTEAIAPLKSGVPMGEGCTTGEGCAT